MRCVDEFNGRDEYLMASHRKKGLPDKLADVGECKSAGAFAMVPPVRAMIRFEYINPCLSHGKATEVEMVFNGIKKYFGSKFRKNSYGPQEVAKKANKRVLQRGMGI